MASPREAGLAQMRPAIPGDRTGGAQSTGPSSRANVAAPGPTRLAGRSSSRRAPKRERCGGRAVPARSSRSTEEVRLGCSSPSLPRRDPAAKAPADAAATKSISDCDWYDRHTATAWRPPSRAGERSGSVTPQQPVGPLSRHGASARTRWRRGMSRSTPVSWCVRRRPRGAPFLPSSNSMRWSAPSRTTCTGSRSPSSRPTESPAGRPEQGGAEPAEIPTLRCLSAPPVTANLSRRGWTISSTIAGKGAGMRWSLRERSERNHS